MTASAGEERERGKQYQSVLPIVLENGLFKKWNFHKLTQLILHMARISDAIIAKYYFDLYILTMNDKNFVAKMEKYY